MRVPRRGAYEGVRPVVDDLRVLREQGASGRRRGWVSRRVMRGYGAKDIGEIEVLMVLVGRRGRR